MAVGSQMALQMVFVKQRAAEKPMAVGRWRAPQRVQLMHWVEQKVLEILKEIAETLPKDDSQSQSGDQQENQDENKDDENNEQDDQDQKVGQVEGQNLGGGGGPGQQLHGFSDSCANNHFV